jgi:hypothetical protein
MGAHDDDEADVWNGLLCLCCVWGKEMAKSEITCACCQPLCRGLVVVCWLGRRGVHLNVPMEVAREGRLRRPIRGVV